MSLHTEKPILKETYVAASAITKRRFIQASGAQCNAIGQMAIGVSGEEDCDSSKEFAVTTIGTALVEAGEALDAGDLVTTNGLGKAVVAGKGHYVNGAAVRSQALAGQLIEIRLGGHQISTVPTTTSTTTTTTTSSSSTTTTTA